tara:strand:- start:110931 stop:112832 length:1902 start_codon:yes stop_codon:yes gene_type:complete
MKILVYLSFLLVITSSCGSIAQEQYKTHYVKEGETVYSIAKQYGVTTEAIYALNPDITNGIKTNSILILPQEGSVAKADIKFKKHKVKRKETLFSISQHYNISVDDIKKYNKDLYSRQLKKGDKIDIPIFPKDPETGKTITATNENSSSNNAKHTVLAKETKFGIARKYGISIPELEKLNPMMGENLQIGTVLNVPNEEVTSSATIEEEYSFYEVQPKEGFFRLKVKLGLSEEQIVALNPYAKEGLKEGMILKIPKENFEVLNTGNAVTVDLENRIVNKSKKHLALMLPFSLKKAVNDTSQSNSELIKDDAYLRIALDFYSGVLMAADFAKDKGISVEIDVYDTERSDAKVGSIIAQQNFKDVDAVIGPLLQKNVQKAAALLKDNKTPVFSPLSNREMKSYTNFFQTLPTDEMLEKAMLNYIKEHHTGKNMILISDDKRRAQKAAIVAAIPGIKTLVPREKGFLYEVDIAQKIEAGKENWVILETGDPVILSNVIGLLNGMPADHQLRLFTLDKNNSYDYHDVSNLHLAKLNFTFPSVNKSYDYKEKHPFLVSYKNKYGVLPNRYAVRGFDITYDVLLRLASADDIYEASEGDFETEYIENKFHYSKQMFSGYQNNALYIIKYMNNLQFEVVE